jgi:hypothetical protein
MEAVVNNNSNNPPLATIRPKGNRRSAGEITPRLLNTKQAEIYLNMSAWKIRNLVQQGKISYIPGEGEKAPWLYDKKVNVRPNPWLTKAELETSSVEQSRPWG